MVRQKSKKKKKGVFKRLLILFLELILLGLSVLGGVFLYFSRELPSPDRLNQISFSQSTKIYDRTGKILLYEIYGTQGKSTYVEANQISKYIKEATVATEDAQFYHHFGINFRGILRAIYYNLIKHRIVQGGSTITQQFIKNYFLSPQKTLSRKIKEAILAIELEMKYSKDEILTMYLNQTSYGSNAHGIEAASEVFFGKHANNLSLAESAILAALPKAPTYYSPYGSHFKALKKRQEYILNRMSQSGYISPKQATEAKKEKLQFRLSRQKIKAPHFVMYIREYLENKYGLNYLERSGLKIYTSLDWPLQQIAEKVIAEGVKKNKKYQAHNGALVAIDPKTGQILAMVGSKDYFHQLEPAGCHSGKNCYFEPNVNVSICSRQPGSSFKPIVYAEAFERGYTPKTILYDVLTNFAIGRQKPYIPKNYDLRTHGPVTIRQALAWSLNIPAVKVLYLAGKDNVISLAHQMGFTTLQHPERLGLALVLGGGEVKLLDEVGAYTVFAQDGIKHPVASILKITDSNGKTLEKFENKPKRVLSAQSAREINSILSDEETRAKIFGSHSPLYLPERPAAAKTGTTDNHRDAWTIGYTPSLAAGVWVGNNDNRPMNKFGAGLYAAAPIWHNFMEMAYQIKGASTSTTNQNRVDNDFTLPNKPEKFTPPKDVITGKSVLDGNLYGEIKVKIDRISGKLATKFTPPDLIVEKIFRQIHCLLYWIDKNNPHGSQPEHPENDPQFWNWERPVLAWASGRSNLKNINQTPPQQKDNLHLPQNKPIIKIIFPKNKSTISQDKISLQVKVNAPLGVKEVDVFLNEKFLFSSIKSEINREIDIPDEIKNGSAKLIVRAYDRVLNRSVEEINFNLDIPGRENYSTTNSTSTTSATTSKPMLNWWEKFFQEEK